MKHVIGDFIQLKDGSPEYIVEVLEKENKYVVTVCIDTDMERKKVSEDELLNELTPIFKSQIEAIFVAEVFGEEQAIAHLKNKRL